MATEITLPILSTGPVRDWLTMHRQLLNNRFRIARQRYPQLDADLALHLLHGLLPPIVPVAAPGSSELLQALFELILLHAGRGTIGSTHAGLQPAGARLGLSILLRAAFPALRKQLSQRPKFLPAALSNVVENLGPRGADFASELVRAAPLLCSANEVHDFSVVLAWRLGEARLREAALSAAAQLPPAAALVALQASDVDPPVATTFIQHLRASAWLDPRTALTSSGRQKSSGGSGWKLVGACGAFIGFDGQFPLPPVLLETGDLASAHRWWVRSGEQIFRLDADLFGSVCRPDPQFTDAQVSPSGRLGRAHLLPNGTLVEGKTQTPFPELTRATSCLAGSDWLACTLADSFRVRILLRTQATG